MKPIRLKIKGFNSFFMEQSIDFEKLIDKGIFGIFGPTGSGKSSIIDAMTFALYGNVSRYDGNERKAFINTNSDSVSVVFEFSLIIDEIVFFTVSREIKVRKNGTFVHNARLIRTVNGISDVIGENVTEVNESIIKIIGLEYKDFIRSVVLPQGKFSEFLMLKNTERRSMLERIFDLEEYGTVLNTKINERRKNQFKIVADIKSKLEVFQDVSKELISNLQNDLKYKEEMFEKNKMILNEKRILFDKYKNYIDLKKEFEFYTLKERDFKSKKKNIDLKVEKIDRGKRAEKTHHFFTVYKKNEKEYNYSVAQFEKFENEFSSINEDFLSIKVDFDEFSDNKKEQYPEIIKKEAELAQGSKIKKDNELLEAERTSLRNDYKKNKKILSEKNSELTKEIAAKNSADNKIFDIEKKKEEINVSPEYRKNVEYSANIEKKYTELEEKYILEEKSLNSLSQNIEKEKKDVDSLDKKISEVKNDIYELEKKKKALDDNSFDFSDIIAAQQKIEEKKRDFFLKKELYIKYNSLSLEFKNIEKKKEEMEEKLNKLLDEENKKNDEFSQISDKIKVLENKEFILELANRLKENTPCPVCGSLEHPMPAEKTADSILYDLKANRDILKKNIDDILEEKNKIKNEISVLSSDFVKTNEEISKIEIDFNDFDVEAREKEIEEESKKFQETQKKFEILRKERKDFEEKEKFLNEQLNKLNVKISKSKSELKKDNEIFLKSENSVNKILEEKNKIFEELVKLRKELGVEDFQKEYLKLIKYEKLKSKYETDEKKNRDISSQKQFNIERIKIEIGEYEKIIESIRVMGKEKKAIIDKNLKRIDEICAGRDFDMYFNEVTGKKLFFEKKEVELRQKFEKLELKKNSALESKVKLEKEKDTLKKIKEECFDELKNSVAKNGFRNVDDAENAYISKDDISFLEKEVDLYNDSFKEILSNLKSISLKLEKEDISCDEEDFQKIKLEIDELSEKNENILSETGQLKNRIDKALSDFDKAEKLKKECKEQTYKLDLISDLADSVKGNRFVEFIAKRQLYYVTIDASERLGKMTNGRYAIELDEQDSNFIIRDNFNGGVRRTPNSLSGGEIFLTSLCLALALSGKIQLKNNAPLETFFLDEGFGTLDSNMLDVVMDSLEQLSCEKINVGVITHVEEIKNRIQSKILVVPDDGIEGSKIKID